MNTPTQANSNYQFPAPRKKPPSHTWTFTMGNYWNACAQTTFKQTTTYESKFTPISSKLNSYLMRMYREDPCKRPDITYRWEALIYNMTLPTLNVQNETCSPSIYTTATALQSRIGFMMLKTSTSPCLTSPRPSLCPSQAQLFWTLLLIDHLHNLLKPDWKAVVMTIFCIIQISYQSFIE